MRPLGKHGLHGRRPSDDLALAPARLLEQNLEALSHSCPVEGLSLILEEVLNNWGAQGWELVQVVTGPEGGLVAYLKREKAAE